MPRRSCSAATFAARFLPLTVPALALALLTLSLTGCGRKDAARAPSPGTAPAASTAPGKKILLYGNGAEPQDLDFQIVTGVPEHHLALTFFEGLVSEDPQLNVVPGVAERWEISPDGLLYNFHLRADAHWSNGDPVTADDFIQSYRRMISPALGAAYANMLWYVVGAEDYTKGKLTDFAQTGFKAPDARTVQLTLRQPTPFLLHAMNHYAWYPLPIATLKKFGALDRKSTPWTRPENFVSNGPYVLKEWRPNQKIVAVRSPTYWDRTTVKIDEIHFLPVELADTEERMFRTGQLHVTNEVPLTKVAVYQRDRPDSLRIDPYNGLYFYRFNVQRKPFDDVRVRRALALAVDRESLVKKVTLAGEQPAYDFTPPDLAGYVSQHAFPADLAEAKRLLAAAGYPDGRGFPKVELLYNTLEKHRTIAEALQQMWRKNLGVDITLFNQEWKVYMDAQHTQNFQIQRAGWIADYVDPHSFFDLWETGGGHNDTHWGNPEYDRLLRTALGAKTTAARYEIYQQMEKILIDEMPVLPLYFYTYSRLISPKVKGFITTPLDNFSWKYADLAP
jgi:oligopeptide transport system substrate-binding protein